MRRKPLAGFWSAGASGAQVRIGGRVPRRIRRGAMACVVWVATLAGCGEFPAIDESVGTVNEATIEAALDARIDAEAIPQCRFELIIAGETALSAIEALIDSAQTQIHIESLLIDADGPIGETGLTSQIVAKLCAKARSGVAVRMIIDAVGQRMFSDIAALQPLRQAGVELRLFVAMPGGATADDLLYRSHKKLLVVDGCDAIVGGRNLGPTYFDDSHHRDTSVQLGGPIVSEIQRQFLRDWASLGEPLSPAEQTVALPMLEAAGEAVVRSIDHRPACDDFDIDAAVRVAITLARSRIRIQTPYWNPTPALLDALIAAAARGVAVEVMTNGPDASDKPASYAASAGSFAVMVDAGIGVQLWNTPGRFLHSKAMVVDDAVAMVGSYNFNFRSSLWDAENAVIVTDAAGVAAVAAMFDADVADPGVVTVDAGWLATQSDETLAFWEFARWIAWVY